MKNTYQRCIDCQFCKWCHDVITGYGDDHNTGGVYEIVKHLKEADKRKFNNYSCFRRKGVEK